VIFVTKDVSRIVFEGGFFGGAQSIWGNLYLNSTTVLFDMNNYGICTPVVLVHTQQSLINDVDFSHLEHKLKMVELQKPGVIYTL